MAYLRPLLVVVSAATVFWLGVGLGSQRGSGRLPVSDGFRVPPIASLLPPVAPPGGPVRTRHPRFKVELVDIHAIDETGWNFLGSDELTVVYDTPEHRIVTSKIGDVDSGDVVQVPPTQSCIWPIVEVDDDSWSCKPQGGAAPLAFAVSLWEWDGAGPWGGFCVTGKSVQPPGAELPCRDYWSWLFNSGIYTYSEADLVQKLPAPGSSFDVEAGYAYPGFWNNWEYLLKVRVTRVADYVEELPVER